MGEEDTYGNHITNGFEELFNNYQDFSGLGYLMLILLSFLDIFIIFIFLLSFMITYLCHLRSRSCCKCKRTCSYVSLIFAMILSIPFIVIACYAKSKINLTNEEIYQFDHDFNQKTKKNINFMKRRRIILIVGASLLYAFYITHFVILCLLNKKIVIEDDNTKNINALNNGDIIVTNGFDSNKAQVTSNENRFGEK